MNKVVIVGSNSIPSISHYLNGPSADASSKVAHPVLKKKKNLNIKSTKSYNEKDTRYREVLSFSLWTRHPFQREFELHSQS